VIYIEMRAWYLQLGTTNSSDYKWGDLRMHQSADQGVLPNPYMPEAFMAAAYDLPDHDSPSGAYVCANLKQTEFLLLA
jgi:hypothetical protein